MKYYFDGLYKKSGPKKKKLCILLEIMYKQLLNKVAKFNMWLVITTKSVLHGNKLRLL